MRRAPLSVGKSLQERTSLSLSNQKKAWMFLNNLGANNNLATILSKTAICWITQDSIPSYNGTIYLFLTVTHIIVSDSLVFYIQSKTLTDLPCLMYFASSTDLLVFMCFLLALIRDTNILIHIVYLTNAILELIRAVISIQL